MKPWIANTLKWIFLIVFVAAMVLGFWTVRQCAGGSKTSCPLTGSYQS